MLTFYIPFFLLSWELFFYLYLLGSAYKVSVFIIYCDKMKYFCVILFFVLLVCIIILKDYCIDICVSLYFIISISGKAIVCSKIQWDRDIKMCCYGYQTVYILYRWRLPPRHASSSSFLAQRASVLSSASAVTTVLRSGSNEGGSSGRIKQQAKRSAFYFSSTEHATEVQEKRALCQRSRSIIIVT